MSDYLRIPAAQSYDKAINDRIMDALRRTGSALPCTLKEVHGPIVTVQIDVKGYTFPPIQCPANQSKYVREPLQAGDTGVVFPVSVYIGNVSGLGGGSSSSFIEQANLSTLMFFTCGSTTYGSVDSTKVVIAGPTGVQTGATGGTATIIHNSSGITITNGDIIVDGISLKNHLHSLVSIGPDSSGPPVPGT